MKTPLGILPPTVPPKGLSSGQTEAIGRYASDPSLPDTDADEPARRGDFSRLSADFRAHVKAQSHQADEHGRRHARELEANLNVLRNIADNVHADLSETKSELRALEMRVENQTKPRPSSPLRQGLIAAGLVVAPLLIRLLEAVLVHK